MGVRDLRNTAKSASRYSGTTNALPLPMKPIFLSTLLAAVPLVAACTGGERASSGECPAGEICSPETPRGLHFIGNAMSDQLLGSLFGPAATAVGGTQEIALEWDRGDGVLVAFTLPYAADDDGALGVSV